MNVQFVPCIHLLPRFLQSLRLTVRAFWKNRSFAECVLREISSAFVDTKLRGIEATCIVIVIRDIIA